MDLQTLQEEDPETEEVKDDNDGVGDEEGHTSLIDLEDDVEGEPEIKDNAGVEDALEEPESMKESAATPKANMSDIGNGDIVEECRHYKRH